MFLKFIMGRREQLPQMNDMAKALCERGFSIDEMVSEEKNSLFSFVLSSNLSTEFLERFLRKSPNVFACNVSGETPMNYLHLSAINDRGLKNSLAIKQYGVCLNHIVIEVLKLFQVDRHLVDGLPDILTMDKITVEYISGKLSTYIDEFLSDLGDTPMFDKLDRIPTRGKDVLRALQALLKRLHNRDYKNLWSDFREMYDNADFGFFGKFLGRSRYLSGMKGYIKASERIISTPSMTASLESFNARCELERVEKHLLSAEAENKVLRQDVVLLTQRIVDLEETNKSLVVRIEERDATVNSLVVGLEERDATVNSLVVGLEERDATVNSLVVGLEERDATVNSLVVRLGERDAAVNSLAVRLEERDGAVRELGVIVHDQHIEMNRLSLITIQLSEAMAAMRKKKHEDKEEKGGEQKRKSSGADPAFFPPPPSTEEQGNKEEPSFEKEQSRSI
jgi:hypothetical protein